MSKADAIRDFTRRFAGQVICPGDADYDSVRRVHNGAISRRPALVAICATVDDVCRAVAFASESQLPLAVRSGGHSQVGHSVCDDGMVIDLSGLKEARLDQVSGVVRAQSGLLAGELDEITQTAGLATTLGQCSSVGLGGLTTGGGFGWLAGKYGLTCDNLISAQMVTSDARKLRAAAGENEDLFWAIRGGGGNYGIAVEFEYQLHPVSQVLGGMLCYPLSQSRSCFAFMREFLTHAPDELATSFGIRPVGDGSAFAVAVCFCGNFKYAERVFSRLESFARPITGSIRPLTYLKVQSLLGEASPGACLHTRGSFMPELPDAAIDTIIECAARNPSAAKSVWFDHYHGAMCRVVQEATAFPVRESGLGLLIQSEWRNPGDARAQSAWINESVDAMDPYSARIAYVASLGEEGAERVKASYGPNYARLATLKRKYDPGNLFRFNQNVPPASG